ncbi:LuxR C-terminal-related transcriptional regulator [Herminiimonas sp. CN]|uniref:LuxR C-terminal-related transcriptional regulator n=1 Tax=Herminiimonas sp. CN TaxID=1349818 RepID=UPI0004743DDB|nr:LuxR C-terminal-related transcriptional regulator [Herminiimonas sp. CN]
MLTERKLQILRLVSAGLSTRKVAGPHHLSPKTGSVRKMLLTGKLNIDSIADLILFAFPH